MKKVMVPFLAVLLGLGFFTQFCFAGGIDNKQNWSARYLATGSRNAATDGADVAAYNPAGLMHQENGLVLQGDVQYLMKGYENSYVERNPAGQVNKEEDEPAIVPSLFTTYKKDKLAFYGTFTVNGGGGHVKYDDGCALLDTIEAVSLQIAAFSTPSFANGLFTTDKIEANTYHLTTTVGAAYEINKMWSVGGGVRYVKGEKEVEANATTVGMGSLVGEYEEEADGWGWVASVNIKPTDKWLIAIRYESAVSLTFETEHVGGTNTLGAQILTTVGKGDGTEYERDLPAVLGAGIAYQATENLILSGSWTYYYEKDADWTDATGNERFTDFENSWDLSLSGTYAINEKMRASVGYMRTDVGIEAADYGLTEQLSPVLDAHSFHCGMGYDVTEKLGLECGLMVNIYDDDTRPTQAGVQNATTYEKSNIGFALGMNYKF